MITRRIVKNAPVVWQHLNGLINIFKPAGVKTKHIKHAIIGNVTKDLNQMQVREPRQMLQITNEEDDRNDYKVSVKPDLSDHVLAVGPRYQIEDVKCTIAQQLGDNTSGVLIVGMNNGCTDAYKLGCSRLLRVYHVTGLLGTGTEDNFRGSRVVAKATFTHVWPDKLSALTAAIQAAHQRKMFEISGVDMQSQTAYDLAVAGVVRPANNTMPIVYGIRCVHFDRPSFTLEVHAINEDEAYLCQLVQEIGLQLHSVAHCTAIRCVRHGQFTVDDAVLRSHWNVQGVVDSMARCRKVLAQHPDMLRQTEATLH